MPGRTTSTGLGGNVRSPRRRPSTIGASATSAPVSDGEQRGTDQATAVALHFLGTGNAFSSGGRGNQAILLSSPNGRWLVDCGPTTILQLHRFGIDPGSIRGVLLTHLHADHALGMPMLLLGLQFLFPLAAPFPVVGPPGTARYLQSAMRLAYPDVVRRRPPLDLAVHEIDGEQAGQLNVDGMAIASLPMRHSVPVNGYRIAVAGRLVAISGDTDPSGALEALGAGADVLIVECNSVVPLPRVSHMSAADHRGRVPYGARRVAFIHVGPDVQAAQREIESELGVEIPADGDVWTL